MIDHMKNVHKRKKYSMYVILPLVGQDYYPEAHTTTLLYAFTIEW